MADFDLASAKPVGSGGFDLASAKPIGQQPHYNPATDFGGDTLHVGPFDTHIPTSQGVQNFLAGAGKATTDLVRGAGQLVGLESRKDVAESRKLDAPLMNTGAGKAGFLTGMTADLLPTAFIPGAGTLAGSAAIGAGTGFLQPSTGTGETLKNVLLGGALGPAGVLGGRAVGALAKGGYAALEPFLPGGAQRIAARTLQAFAGGPQAAVQAAHELTNAPAVLPGVQPTMGELTSNAGVAQLQRSLASNPETMAQISARDQANRAAMTGAIDSIAGTAPQRAAAVRARTASASPMYDMARAASVPADDTLKALLQRPSMERAWNRAQQLAEENGMPLKVGEDVPEQTIKTSVLDSGGKAFTQKVPATQALYSARALQYLKMALQDMTDGSQTGIGAHEQRALQGTLKSLNDWTTEHVPEMRAADAEYARMSQPINQMDVGTELRDRLVPALADFGNVPRLNANAFANAVRNGDEVAQRATGLGNATLSGTLTPQQMATVRLVGEQLARRANAADLGRAAGSNTAQNLAGQNLLRQFMGPFGLPQSTLGRAASSVLGRSLARPYGFVAQAAEPDIQQFIAQAALHPKLAAQMLSRPTAKALSQVWKRQGYLTPLTNVGLIANSAQ